MLGESCSLFDWKEPKESLFRSFGGFLDSLGWEDNLFSYSHTCLLLYSLNINSSGVFLANLPLSALGRRLRRLQAIKKNHFEITKSATFGTKISQLL
ncbi:unnamed protein product [Moneuplotes crassus]|uniref:Uncharacterized protein n=1 Tax=Euplotes crassus TaxID=5936 RepID=A0AAD1Y5A5_EUPCR|nr:unnamed protein product [Moneuplotes crassus]